VVPSQVEVLVGLSRLEGQMSAFINLTTAQGDAITRMDAENGQFRDRMLGEQSLLRDRVTALEATAATSQRERTPWHVTAGVIAPWIALLLVVAERLYSK
jgi:hypothetical protein